ncbi:MAG: SpoIIE family protein phosphatase [Desulfobacterales bacterium]|nr:SpoIIE family protein phosphatase [Desulfobacterales bacterium]
MFYSLKSKIVCLIVAVMGITALVLISVSGRETGAAMMDQQDRLARHVLSLVDLNIKGEYHNLIADKILAVKRHKDLLKVRTQLLVRMMALEEAAARRSNGAVENARGVILDWVRGTRDPQFGSYFIADGELNVLASPNADIAGTNIAGLRDMKDRCLEEALSCFGSDNEPVLDVVNWTDKKGRTSKYLVAARKYAPWDWYGGMIIDIATIEAEAQQRLEKIVENLNQTLGEIVIAQSGFPFIFDSGFQVVARGGEAHGEGLAGAVNTRTGRSLFEDLAQAGEAGLVFESRELFQGREVAAHVSYFKPLGWTIGVMVPMDEIKAPARAIVTQQSIVIGVILFCAVLLTVWVVSHISRPLNLLATKVKDFSTTDFTQAGDVDGELLSLAEAHRDEVGRLSGAFADMEAQLRENVRKLIDTLAENQRIEGELNVAKAIQLGLLPKIFPAFPDREGLDIHASLEPAKEVGGDLYDFYFVDEHRLCFTIGDVSGKGVPAALMMAITKTLIKSAAFKHDSPAQIMTEVNETIAGDNPQSMFVTLLVGILDLETGRIVYANGGHNLPIRVSPGRDCEYVEGTSGPLVGIMDGVEYSELTLDLEPGESLFLYTDGVTEAQDPEKQFYTEERLLTNVISLVGESPEGVISTLGQDLKIFADVEPQFDDIAMLMVQYRGNA